MATPGSVLIASPTSGGETIAHHDFLTPDQLSVTETPLRALIIGQCVVATWADVIHQIFPGSTVETELFNNAWHLQPRDLAGIDFQLVAVPLRAVLPEVAYMTLGYDDPDAYARLFDECCDRLRYYLELMLAYNRDCSLLTFVANFFVPIANPMGRLLPRYDLRNPGYFIEELNRKLDAYVREYRSAHVFDMNQVAAAVGKRFVQDDSVSAISHNAIMLNHALHWDQQRIEAPANTIQEVFAIQEREFIIAAWREIVAMFRTIRGIDGVKMVVMDLDDTLWRGVAGDAGGVDQLEQAEGWPLGVVEALSFLKKRGVLLAIASKNEESYIRKIWPYTERLNLDAFAFVRINWKPKGENVSEMIRLANILPSSVVFVDDNPVERRAVAVANPGIRVLGHNPYLVRSILLWSSETQVPFITEESVRRTEMIQSQERRENDRGSMSRADFLASQDIRLAVGFVDPDSPRFQRAFELLNKTNQFNTTGRRWTEAELRDALATDTGMHCFTVVDRFSDYGLVGVVLIRGNNVEQFTMSCRVLGMDVEIGALATLNNVMLACCDGPAELTATLVHTAANFPCRNLYERAGYRQAGERWVKDMAKPALVPAHLSLVPFS